MQCLSYRDTTKDVLSSCYFPLSTFTEITSVLCQTPRVKSRLNAPHSTVHSCCLDFFRCSQIKCLTGVISWFDHTASKSLLKWSFPKSRVCSGLLQSSKMLKWQSYTLFKDTKSRLWVIFSLCENLAQERRSCTLLAETGEHASDCKFIYQRKLQWFRSVRFLRQTEILWSIMVTW